MTSTTSIDPIVDPGGTDHGDAQVPEDAQVPGDAQVPEDAQDPEDAQVPPDTGVPEDGGNGPRIPGRARWLAALALVAVVMVGGAVYYYLTRPVPVEMSVDGETIALETRADTVAELLTEREITTTPQDLVTPGPDEAITEGQTIVVKYARPFTVVIDGEETEHTTTELTVGEALTAVDAPTEGADVSLALTDRLPRSGTTVEIITPKAVTVNDGGTPIPVTSNARTVGEVLDAQGIELSGTDVVDPALDTTVTPDLTIAITRIRVENEVRTEPVTHETVEQNDPDRTVGTRKVVTEGVDGTKDVTYAVTYTNGEVTAEEAVESIVTQEAVTEVVAVGTKPKPAPAAPQATSTGGSSSSSSSESAPSSSGSGDGGGSAGGLNWTALANCESSGNPRAVNPAGYYGLYQFSLSTWRSVGGTGNPADAPASEQTQRAQTLYNRSGAGQWPHCGKYLFQ
ncbi:MAG: ubiquitin-like domain-containing protein [Acidimicrobiales bacterium]